MEKLYEQHDGKVINADNRFKHVMAITLDPRTANTEGVARCITNRDGDVTGSGSIDRSMLYKITGDPLGQFEIRDKLEIKNDEIWISKLTGSGNDFLGLEDPDIWIDENSLLHLYFTIAFRKNEHTYEVSLGHAVGMNLNSLEMTEPSLIGSKGKSAKEVSIVPLNSRGIRLNLIESSLEDESNWCSTVRIAIADDMDKPWRFGETVFNPLETDKAWITGHASPGPLLPESFIDVGNGKRLGILNGRAADQKIDGKKTYGIFSVGLFIYDYEEGKVDWVSSQPLIIDSEAKSITFASHFVETVPGEGILYAHVDDSFVRAYTLKAELLKSVLPVTNSNS